MLRAPQCILRVTHPHSDILHPLPLLKAGLSPLSWRTGPTPRGEQSTVGKNVEDTALDKISHRLGLGVQTNCPVGRRGWGLVL